MRPNQKRNVPGEEAIVLAAEAVVGATTTAVIHGSRANRAGSFEHMRAAMQNTRRIRTHELMPEDSYA